MFIGRALAARSRKIGKSACKASNLIWILHPAIHKRITFNTEFPFLPHQHPSAESLMSTQHFFIMGNRGHVTRQQETSGCLLTIIYSSIWQQWCCHQLLNKAPSSGSLCKTIKIAVEHGMMHHAPHEQLLCIFVHTHCRQSPTDRPPTVVHRS